MSALVDFTFNYMHCESSWYLFVKNVKKNINAKINTNAKIRIFEEKPFNIISCPLKVMFSKYLIFKFRDF